MITEETKYTSQNIGKGVFVIKEFLVIKKDGKEISRSSLPGVQLTPGADVSKYPEEIREMCQRCWVALGVELSAPVEAPV